jgi:hypothetical protein
VDGGGGGDVHRSGSRRVSVTLNPEEHKHHIDFLHFFSTIRLNSFDTFCLIFERIPRPGYVEKNAIIEVRMRMKGSTSRRLDGRLSSSPRIEDCTIKFSNRDYYLSTILKLSAHHRRPHVRQL